MDSQSRWASGSAPITTADCSSELLSTALFLGTVLYTAQSTRRTSRWRRRCRAALLRFLPEEDDDDNNKEDKEEEPYRSYSRQESNYPPFGVGVDAEEDPYVYRRMHSRLSFHGDDDDDNRIHLPPSLLPAPSTKLSVTPQNRRLPRNASTKYNNHKSTTATTPPTGLEEDGNAEAFGGESDFYPKNANWSHFDLTELWYQQSQQQVASEATTTTTATTEATLPNPSSTSSTLPVQIDAPTSPTRRQVSLEGDNYHHNQNSSNHGMTPQFVWTAATGHKHNQKELRQQTDPTASQSSSFQVKDSNLVVAAPRSEATVKPKSSSTTAATGTQHLPQSKSKLTRAESLDDRTVWGRHRPTDDDPTAERHEPEEGAVTDERISFADLRPKKPDARTKLEDPVHLPSRKSSNACRLSQPFLARRSQSVPDLAAHFAQSGSIQDYDRDLAASVRRQNTKARARYNACIMPHAVILIRHGQSMGNINEELYSAIPDNAMPLTKLGWEQAHASGRILRQLLSDRHQSPHFIVSPYVRTVETFHGLVSAWCDPSEFHHITDREARLAAWYSRLLELGLTWHEDPRIREQDFGNYQNASVIKQAKKDRHRFGAFYYRFPHGESASDVFDRISTFLDSLWRSFDVNKSRVYVLVTHGIAIRVLLARYFRYTISQFSMLANPRNGEMVVLRHDGRGRLKLAGRYELELQKDENGEPHVVGVAFHQRLKVLPPEYIRKVPIRISYDDNDDEDE